MPRGSSRLFRTRMDGAAADLGISGGVANRLTDKTFRHFAAGAYKAQGFSVDGPNVSRVFQENADLAISELGLSAFTAQTMSLNFPTEGSTDALRNTTEQALGIANAWSLGVWFNTTIPEVASPFVFVTAGSGPAVNNDRINLYHDSGGSNRLRFDWGDQSGLPIEITAFNNYYTGRNGLWTHILAVWTGSILLMFKNGVSVGAPDVGVNNPAITMVDSIRAIGLGNLSTPGNSSVVGNIAQCQLWRVDVTALATNGVGAFLQSSPSAINLNVDSPGDDYLFASDLAHWWRPGHEADPNIGRDYAEAGFTPTIDLGVNAVGITDGDRQANVP